MTTTNRMQTTTSSTGKVPISVKTYFPTLKFFSEVCRHDRRLTPNTQLIYRLLLEKANSAMWADSFLCSDTDLHELSHVAKQTITDAKRTLKNLGYIDFGGKPTKYTVYSLVVQEVGNELGDNVTPCTPKYNTSIQDTSSVKKKLRKEESRRPRRNGNGDTNGKTGGADKTHYIEYDWENDPELDQFV